MPEDRGGLDARGPGAGKDAMIDLGPAWKSSHVQPMFDRIARRYDLVNRVMTLGFDRLARDLAARSAARPGTRVVLDLGCGTGDQALAASRVAPGALVVGVDFSQGMLARAARKFRGAPEATRVHGVRGDCLALGVRDAAADAVVSAWVLRNVADVPQALREARRVLLPGGRAAFLELTPVRSRAFGVPFRWYFHRVVPWIGACISGHELAYTYLPESVDGFMDAESLAHEMRAAGYAGVTYRRLAFGTLALHVGTAAPSPRALPTNVRRWPNRADDWDAALRAIPGAHALQSWAWGEFRRATGWTVERVAWERDGVPVAAAAILRRRLPIPGLGVAYVPKGPVVDPACPEAWPTVLSYLATFARERRCIFVKVDPDVPHADAAVESALANAGFTRSRHQVQYPATMVADLDGDDAALMARMRQTWRRYVRKAEREGVRVEVTGDPSVREVEEFLDLYRETAGRDGFVIREDDYYRQALGRLCPAGLATLHLARRGEDVVAAAVVLRFGQRAWYLWGATSAAGLEAHAMYRVQWDAMRWARDAGCLAYDMWGAPEDPESTSDPLRGVAWFKAGFGARHVRWTGAWDHAPWPMAYRAWMELLPRVVAAVRRLRGERSGHAVVAPG